MPNDPLLDALPLPITSAYEYAKHLLWDCYWAIRRAAEAVGRPLPDRYALPEAEQDYREQARPGATPDPYAPLGLLANVWLISEECDPRAGSLTGLCPRLYESRMRHGMRQPVRIGPETATSVTEGLLQAARGITAILGSNFGCGRLIQIVQKSFPRDDPDADPWLFNIILVLCVNVQDPQLFWYLAEKRAARSEFLRRLLTHDIQEAVLAVRTGPLCEWLLKTFEDFDADELRTELRLEFASIAGGNGMEPRAKKKRIPPALRTRPLTLQEAALLMGYRYRGKTPRQAAKQLKAAMDARAVAFEQITRQQFVFSRNDFPKEVWPKLVPTGPKSS
jgi:hypothetical protein